MRHPVAATALSLVLAAPATAGTAGFEPALETAGERLGLRSTGTAYYARVIGVYDAALYSPPGSSAGALAAGSVPRCLVLAYRRNVTRDLIVTAANEVLASQGIAPDSLGEPLERLHAAYRDVRAGDRYRLCHTPGGSAELALNDEVLARAGGDAFAAAYFGIWLRDGAISEPLREALLGRELAPAS